jgi:UDP-3-O-[3-hydroxymyristoyl] glucosamine N-acyltransferase
MKPKQVSYLASKLSEAVSATLYGDANRVVSGLAPANSPQPGQLAFVKSRSASAAQRILANLSGMAVLTEEHSLPPIPSRATLDCTILVVPDPQRAFVELIPWFYEPERVERTTHDSAAIDPSAQIAADVSIGPNCVIGPGVTLEEGVILHAHVTLYRDVSIGAHSELHSGVVVREGCVIGARCCIHNNSVIGADGFGYLVDPKRGILKVPQLGVVRISDDVEIGAGSCIDKGAIGLTLIGPHTKIDNHVQIGHNVTIGSQCILCAQVGIAGSVTLHDRVVLGDGTGFADHVTVASDVRTGGHSGITTDIDAPGDYLGMPAIPATLYPRQQVALK